MSLSTTLSTCSLPSHRRARILLLPLGEVPQSWWFARRCQLQQNREWREVPMRKLTEHVAQGKDSPFKHIDWQNGHLELEWIDGAVPSEQAEQAQLSISPQPAIDAAMNASKLPYETNEDDDDEEDDDEDEEWMGMNRARRDNDSMTHVPMVSAPSSLLLHYDWDELCVHNKVMAVVCFVHLPSLRSTALSSSSDSSSSSSSSSLDGFELVRQQFQDVRAQLFHPGGPFIFKCWCFGANRAQRKELVNNMDRLWTVFPRSQLEVDPRYSPPLPQHGQGQASSSPATQSPFDGPDDEHFSFFLRSCIEELSLGLLDNFEASIKKLPPHADLKSPLDAAARTEYLSSSSGSNPVALSSQAQAKAQASRAKKVRPGRQKKYIADYCLLAGDPISAIKHYKAAIDASRNVSDAIWQAAALEGHAAALVALEDEKGAEHASFQQAVVEMCEEALTILSRVGYASMRSIELSFELARYLMKYGRRCAAVEVLMRMYELKMDCSAHDQISLAIEAAIIMHQLSFHRKFGFFLVQAAGLYRELHQSASCSALLALAATSFRLDEGVVAGSEVRGKVERKVQAKAQRKAEGWMGDENDNGDEEEDEGEEVDDIDAYPVSAGRITTNSESLFTNLSTQCSLRRKERGYRTGRWVYVQRSVLEHMIFSAKQMRDDVLTARCTAYLLRTLHPWLDAAYQSSLASDLVAATKFMPINGPASASTAHPTFVHHRIDLVGIPVLHAIRPIELTEELRPLTDPSPSPDAPQRKSSMDSNQSGLSMGMDEEEGCARLIRAEAAASGDVFLTRPDEDDPKKQQAKRLRYVCDESFDVEVYLSNPLKIPLLIQHISLSTSGVAFDAFPASLTLAPETFHHRILVSGLPRSIGSLRLRGVFIRTCNIMTEHLIDKHGRGIRPNYDDPDNSPYCPALPLPLQRLPPLLTHRIDILPPLPLLSLTFDFAPHGSMSSSLCLGESRTCLLLLRNDGPVPIADLELVVKANFVSMTQASQDKYYENKLEAEEIRRNLLAKNGGKPMQPTQQPSSQLPSTTAAVAAFAPPPMKELVRLDKESWINHLPLQPGCCIPIPVHITAHTDCSGATFTLCYARDSSSSLFRCIKHPVSWNVSGGVLLRSIHVFHFAPTSPPPAPSPTSTSAAAATQLSAPLSSTTHATDRVATSAPTSVTSSVPVAFSPITSPSTVTTTASNHSTSTSTWTSTQGFGLDVSALSLDDCVLSMELINPNDACDFWIQCHVDSALYKPFPAFVEKSSENRLLIPLPRLSLGSRSEESHLRQLANTMASALQQYHFQLHGQSRSYGHMDGSLLPSDEMWKNDPIFNVLLQRFQQRVQLTWRSSDESHGSLLPLNAHGKYVPALSCMSPLHLVRCLPDPVQFDYSLTLLPPEPSPDGQETDALGSPIPSSSADEDLDPSPRSISTSLWSQPSVLSSSGSQSHSHTGVVRAHVGRLHRLLVRVRNHSNVESLPGLELTIVPFQESAAVATNMHEETHSSANHAGASNNGSGGGGVHDRVLFSGTLTTRFGVLQPGESAEHSVKMCFTAVGRVNFQFVARILQHPSPDGLQTRSGSMNADATTTVITATTPKPKGSVDHDESPFTLLHALARNLAFPPSASSRSRVRRGPSKDNNTPPLIATTTAAAPSVSVSTPTTRRVHNKPHSTSSTPNSRASTPSSTSSSSAHENANGPSNADIRSTYDGSAQPLDEHANMDMQQYELDEISDSDDEDDDEHEMTVNRTIHSHDAPSSKVDPFPTTSHSTSSALVYPCPHLLIVHVGAGHHM